MGQLALGLRSLLFKAIVFFVMAALLAWALGGTLWPRAEIVRLERVSWDHREWFWEAAVGGRLPGEVRWRLMATTEAGEVEPFEERLWLSVSGPVVCHDGLYYAGLAGSGGPWVIERVAPGGAMAAFEVPDRLAVEQQLARLAAGLALQDTATILRQRAVVLDPPDEVADE